MFNFKFLCIALSAFVATSFSPARSNLLARNALSAMVKVAPAVAVPKSPTGSGSTVAASGDHSTLAAAIAAAGLGGVLDGPGPIVVFAPTDAAFKSVDVVALLQDIPRLTEILKFHVSKNSQMPTRYGCAYDTLALHPDGEAKEVGVRVTVDTGDNYLMGGTEPKAKVLSSIQTANGYVHVIDQVLIPYEGKEPPYMAIKEPVPSEYTTPKHG